jgi:adenine-specific DNA-methyltransferase
LPLLAINSVTLIGAEINGRSYGGGVLKMEPSEAALLPLPTLDILETAWQKVSRSRAEMDGLLAAGEWTKVTRLVDEAVLSAGLGLDTETTEMLQKSAAALRARRLNRA